MEFTSSEIYTESQQIESKGRKKGLEMILLDGKVIAEGIRNAIKEAIATVEGRKRKPGLAVLLVGEHPPSHAYVRMKKKACEEVGFHSIVHHLPSSISEEELLANVVRLNRDKAIDGILIQLPLPSHINPEIVTSAVSPLKDVDGLHPVNMGKLLLGQEGGFAPCTPEGIRLLLEKYKIEISGKHVVILGRSNLVGKPLAAILMQKKPGCNATVTLAHSGTNHLSDLCQTADIIVAAIGQPFFVKENMVKEGAVVVDVGINQIKDLSCKSDYRLVGDVDFEKVKHKCAAITPVPGGVGPMTIAQLLNNTWLSNQRSRE